MHSTTKQRAEERRSRQAVMMSDVKHLDVMLGSYSRNEPKNNSADRNKEVDVGSDRLREDVNQDVEDFRSLRYFEQ